MSRLKNYDDVSDPQSIYSTVSNTQKRSNSTAVSLILASSAAFAACVFRKEILSLASSPVTVADSTSKKEPPFYLSTLAVSVPAATVYAGSELVKLLKKKA